MRACVSTCLYVAVFAETWMELSDSCGILCANELQIETVINSGAPICEFGGRMTVKVGQQASAMTDNIAGYKVVTHVLTDSCSTWLFHTL